MVEQQSLGGSKEMDMEDYIMQMQNITKLFPGVRALDDVTFNVKRGEIHSLVGENGAGKSTLMKILSGVYPKGSFNGTLLINGEPQEFTDIKDSEKAGIGIIYQELGLVRTMSVCENIFLGNEIKKRKIIDWNKQFRLCRELLEEVGLDVSHTTIVGTLGTGKQQLVEIAKALSKDIQILILDEPTSSLTEADAKNLFRLLMQLKKMGKTCIFISHKLNEVMEISDNITVLRDGKTITTQPITEMSENKMISYMVGREMKERFPRQQHTPGDVVLETVDWTLADPENSHKNIVDKANIKVRRGEILGIAGLMGAGRTELAMSLFGAYKKDMSGTIKMYGREIIPPKTPRAALNMGLAYLSEDRKQYGLVLTQTIRMNMTLSSLDKITRFGVINDNEEVSRVNDGIKTLHIKTPSIFQIVANLSGGNQQKVVFVKSLLTDPKILFLDEPTRGIDVGAKFEIYQLMNKLVDDGLCVVMISSELPEILGMSDRIYVMHEGKIQAELDCTKGDVTQEEVLFYAAGGKKGE